MPRRRTRYVSWLSTETAWYASGAEYIIQSYALSALRLLAHDDERHRHRVGSHWDGSHVSWLDSRPVVNR